MRVAITMALWALLAGCGQDKVDEIRFHLSIPLTDKDPIVVPDGLKDVWVLKNGDGDPEHDIWLQIEPYGLIDGREITLDLSELLMSVFDPEILEVWPKPPHGKIFVKAAADIFSPCAADDYHFCPDSDPQFTLIGGYNGARAEVTIHVAPDIRGLWYMNFDDDFFEFVTFDQPDLNDEILDVMTDPTKHYYAGTIRDRQVELRTPPTAKRDYSVIRLLTGRLHHPSSMSGTWEASNGQSHGEWEAARGEDWILKLQQRIRTRTKGEQR